MGKKKKNEGNCWVACSPTSATSCAVIGEGDWEIFLDKEWAALGIDFGLVLGNQSLFYRYGKTEYKFVFQSPDEGFQQNTDSGRVRPIRRKRKAVSHHYADSEDSGHGYSNAYGVVPVPSASRTNMLEMKSQVRTDLLSESDVSFDNDVNAQSVRSVPLSASITTPVLSHKVKSMEAKRELLPRPKPKEMPKQIPRKRRPQPPNSPPRLGLLLQSGCPDLAEFARAMLADDRCSEPSLNLLSNI